MGPEELGDIVQADGGQFLDDPEEKDSGVRVQVGGGVHQGGQVLLPAGPELGKVRNIHRGEDAVESLHEPLPLLLGEPAEPVVQGPVPVFRVGGELVIGEVGPLQDPGEGVVLEKAQAAAADHLAVLPVVQQETHDGGLGQGLFDFGCDGQKAEALEKGLQEAGTVVGVDFSDAGLNLR